MKGGGVKWLMQTPCKKPFLLPHRTSTVTDETACLLTQFDTNLFVDKLSKDKMVDRAKYYQSVRIFKV